MRISHKAKGEDKEIHGEGICAKTMVWLNTKFDVAISRSGRQERMKLGVYFTSHSWLEAVGPGNGSKCCGIAKVGILMCLQRGKDLFGTIESRRTSPTHRDIGPG